MAWAIVSIFPMVINRLFNRTRWRFAIYYAGIMGVILAICGASYHQLLKQVRIQALTQEIETLSGTIHDGLGAVLQKPGQLNLAATQFLPGLCQKDLDCPQSSTLTKRHILGVVKQDAYYIQLLDLSGQTVATLGQPVDSTINARNRHEGWQVLASVSGERFMLYSLLLETTNHARWGYMQVGRSLNELDQELAATQQLLLWGWPVTMLFIFSAGWWLAGLSMKPVQQSYENIQKFTANAAHELRTPLSAAKATVESALEMEHIQEQDARKMLQTVNRQINRLTQLVRDLMLLSLIDTEQDRQVSNKACQLLQIINDIMDEFIALSEHANLKLSVEANNSGSLWVDGDEEQLYRMLANLVMNAIQYTLEGGTIIIRLRQDNRQALIEVQDTGIGVPVEQQVHIFKRFYRVNGDRNRKTGGSGLGLAIAQAIAHKHGGKITVQSQLGQGSLFQIILPIVAASKG